MHMAGCKRIWVGGVAHQNANKSAGVAELNIRERTRHLAPEKQQTHEQMMCAAMQHVW